MNVCLCGAEARYPHAQDCPYPLYKATHAQYLAWGAARRARRRVLKLQARADANRKPIDRSGKS